MPDATALTSALLTSAGFRHAFFTRRGGVSPPPWESLNFAANTGDAPERVAENLARAARVLGVEAHHVYFLSQVHGVASRAIGAGDDRSAVLRSEGDITLSSVPGVACGVRSADCVPVLVGDRASGAVAAVHSGWRGTMANATAAGIAALREMTGARGDLVVAIGPHVQACCFEVGADVSAQLAACSSAGERAVVDAGGTKRRVDLRMIVRAQAEAEGVAPAAVDDVLGCTICAGELFHSYRRDGPKSGRLLSAIVPRG